MGEIMVDFNDELIQQYKYLLLKIISKWRRSLLDYDFDDLFSECLFVMYQCTQTYDDTKGKSFMSYLHDALNYRFLRLYRDANMQKRKGNYEKLSLDGLLSQDVFNLHSQVSEDGVRDKHRALLRDVLEYVQENHAGGSHYFNAYFLDDLTQAEVAKKFGVSSQYVNARLKRIREDVRQYFNY